MAQKSAGWDVWFVAADQVYRGVPTDVAAGWASSGRLAGQDKLRPAGSTLPWQAANTVPGISGLLAAPAAMPFEAGPPEAAHDLDIGPRIRRPDTSDDEVDMIPLIDISLVLLVFFMMTTVVASAPLTTVPEMKYAETLSGDMAAIVIQIEPGAAGSVLYAVRVGNTPPTPDQANLKSPAELFARLDALAAARSEPPAVRIACTPDLASDVVWELTGELAKREKANKIRSYTADVTEKP